jgi:hypothetical protein
MPIDTTRIHKLTAAAITALACTLLIAACGASSHKRPTGGANAFIAFSKCMRTHGVTDFPDPSGGGGLNIGGTGINPQAPAFRSAQAACVKLMPGGGPKTHATAQQVRQATDTSECMRDHGVTGFPDPIVTASPPPFSPGKYSSAAYGNGMFIGVPSSIDENSPAFQAAAKACHFG